LCVVRQIERVTHTGRYYRRRAAFDSFLECEHAFGDVFIPTSKRFEHQVEISADGVDRARADVVIR
jgi:hypothetical protein